MPSFSGTTPTDAVELQKLLASDLASGEYFGRSVALSLDGTTAIVGAMYESTSPYANNGAAYVFTRVSGAWVQQQKLLASDLADDYFFGFSVALSSDGNTALVGSPYQNSQGAAYAYTRSGGVWTQQQIIKANVPAFNDEFGGSVALSSNGNTALIGAPGRSTSPYAGDGAAYVFTRTTGTWTQQGAELLAGTRGDGFFFGNSVSLSSNGNTAIIGAKQENASVVSQGSAYIFTRSGSTWTRIQKLLASDPNIVDLFGWSVAISADGLTTIIGAISVDSSGYSNNGAAYVFTLSAGTWTEQQKLLASELANSDNFGYSVSLSSDGNIGLIGAVSKDLPFTNNGAAYVFTRSGVTWTQQQRLLASDRADYDEVGVSVALSTDGKIAMIGAHQESTSPNTYNGATYIYALGRTLDNKLYSYNSTSGFWDVSAFGELLSPTTDIFTSSNTFVVPTGAKVVEVTCIGGGGGGGGGARNVSGDGGGSGGGGAGLSKYVFRAEDIGGVDASITVTVGTGGAGGTATAIGTSSLSGDSGTSGGTTSFGAYLYAYGGANGLGGTTSSRTGGAGGVGMFVGNTGGQTSAGSSGDTTGAGGGGGGGASFGGGSVPSAFNIANPSGSGAAGTSNASLAGPGSGGNGRTSTTTTVSIAGDGGLYGGGGAGGGEGSTAGATGAGGAAGAGANGVCVVRVWYG